MFEANKYLRKDRKKGSNFQEKYVDTSVAYDGQKIGGTTFFKEQTKAEATKNQE